MTNSQSAANGALPLLYSFRRCPYAMRARLALRAAAIRCELREVVLRDKPPELAACSPKATVPVLVLSDGPVIDESLDIIFWALAQSDPEGWLDIDRENADSLIARNDNGFKESIDRYKYPDRYPGATRQSFRTKGETFLAELEERLEGGSFLFGSRLSIADIALLPFVRQFAHVDIDWFRASRYQRVNDWLQCFVESARFADVMEKYAQWRTGDRAQVF
jgi:glutathione S-transferase